jgi:SulP family sulfate permease
MFASPLIVGVAAFLLGWTVPGAEGRVILRVAGTVPSSLPAPYIPDIKLSWIPELASDSVAIAFRGLLEALTIAKSIANQTKQPLDYNRQCLAEGESTRCRRDGRRRQRFRKTPQIQGRGRLV